MLKKVVIKQIYRNLFIKLFKKQNGSFIFQGGKFQVRTNEDLFYYICLFSSNGAGDWSKIEAFMELLKGIHKLVSLHHSVIIFCF